MIFRYRNVLNWTNYFGANDKLTLWARFGLAIRYSAVANRVRDQYYMTETPKHVWCCLDRCVHPLPLFCLGGSTYIECTKIFANLSHINRDGSARNTGILYFKRIGVRLNEPELGQWQRTHLCEHTALHQPTRSRILMVFVPGSRRRDVQNEPGCGRNENLQILTCTRYVFY